MSLNDRILFIFNSVLRHRLFNYPFAACSFINLDFLLPHTAHFDLNIVLSILVFKTMNLDSLNVFCTLHNMSTCFIMKSKFWD